MDCLFFNLERKKNIGIGKISLFYTNFFLIVESTKKLHVVKKIQKKKIVYL